MHRPTAFFIQARCGTALACIALLALGGCAVGPRYTAPGPIAGVPGAYPVATGTATDAPPADRWWLAFEDPVLNELVARALADNPDLAAAEARVQQSRAAAEAVGAAFYPSLNAAGRVSRDKLSLNGENLALIPIHPARTEFTDYRLGFDASWEIDLAGHTRREVEAAVARFGSAGESRNDARVVVASEVASSYVDYRTNTARKTLAIHSLKALDETVRLLGLQQAAGVASAADVQRTGVAQAQTASTLPILEAGRQIALFRLAALTGQSPEALTGTLTVSAPIPAAPTTVPVGLPSELLKRRPDVRHAERSLAESTAEVGSAIAAQFPRFALVGDFGWDSVRSGDLTSAASRYWNVAPQLTVPLFAGGRLRSQVSSAKAGREAALASYRATILKAFADADSALVHFASERSRNESLTSAAAIEQATLALERRRFAVGDTSTLEVLAAERTADLAADQRLVSDAELARSYVALGKALGGGWQSAP